MFKYSYDALVYSDEDIEKSVYRVASFGYDAIELVGEPDNYEISEVKKSCEKNGIVVSSMCSIYHDQRDMVSPDPQIRKQAIDYIKSVVDFAVEAGASIVIARPSPCMKTIPYDNQEEEQKWAVEGLYESGEYANNVNVNLALEAWNRYETYFLNRLEQCLELRKKIELPNIGVMGDTFHMNIEEDSMEGSIKNAGKDLIHLHAADSNRAAPGSGHIDFKPIVKALKDIQYEGYISFELLPASADPLGMLKKGGGKEFFDKYTKQAIDHMKALEKEIM